MQNATILRYCAIEDTDCAREVHYHGDWTYFLAYPSGKYWSDFSQNLRDELSERGIVGVRWEDVVQGELLFTKVCDGVHGHDFVIAEVTEPNANVLLEIGYALAVGRQPLLLIDDNRTNWQRLLLRTLESCHYRSRDDIHAYILKLASEPRKMPTTPDRKLPFLESMGIFERDEQPGTVYHLRPKMVTDPIKRVDAVLRGSFFKPTTMDPTDAVYDEFYVQARKIQESQLVVASLLSTSHANSVQLNANVALLIGFAIGLGKRILVLQQEPATPILDLGTLLRPFNSETEAKNITEHWIGRYTQESVSQGVAKRQVAVRQRSVDKIRGLYLGHPDALQDYALMDYFIPTKEFDDAVSGKRTFFIGRRGSGKSANFQALAAELNEYPNTIFIEIAPNEFEFQRITGFLEDQYVQANPDLVYQTAWNYVLVTEIVKALAEKTLRLYSSPQDHVRDKLYTFYEEERELLSLDFGSRLVAKLQQVSRIPTDISADQKRVQLESTIKTLRDYDVARLLRDFAQVEGITYFIAIDDLDKHWIPDSKSSIDLLIGLLSEVDRQQRFFEGKLKVVLFLREDIYDVMSLFDDDLPKRNLLRMDWTPQNLKHLVAERIAVGTGTRNDDDERTWQTLFEDQVKGEPADDYITSRSLPRPRDVLDFCQKSLDQAQRNGHSYVTEQDILDAEMDFSESLYRSVSLEFRSIYPGLDDVLLEFAEYPESVGWQRFRTHANDILEKHSNSISHWYGSEHADARFLAEVLFKIGFIGFASAGRQLGLFGNGRSFAETWSLVSPSPQILIHPAFFRVLEIHPSSLSQSGRRRRVRPDSLREALQLPLNLPEY